MRERKWGRVLTIAGSGMVQAIPNLSISNTGRSVMVALSNTLSSEVAKDGVNVNFVIPGKIDDDRAGELDGTNAKRQGKTAEEIRKGFETQIPAGCYGKVEEFAKTSAFLASDAASYITGQMTRVDGSRIRSI